MADNNLLLMASPHLARKIGLLLLIGAMSVAGCTSTEPTSSSVSSTSLTISTTLPPSTVTTNFTPLPTVTSSIPIDNAPCSVGPTSFISEGAQYLDQNRASDAAVIDTITWRSYQSCERFSLSLVTPEGAPAVRPPAVSLEALVTVAIVRVRLERPIGGSPITNQLVDSSYVERFYVVQENDRTVFVDFHLSSPAEARIETQDSPAQLLIDFRSSDTPARSAAVFGSELVLTTPDLTNDSYPFRVDGYVADTNLESVPIIITGAEGNETIEADLPTDNGLWRSFSALVDSGPLNPLQIQVGNSTLLPLG